MFKKTVSEKRILTPTGAESYLAFNTFGGQRKINEKHVRSLSNKMQNGLFRTAMICLAKTPHGSTYLMDGQHTCTAVLETGVTVDAIVEEYICETTEDLGILFNQFEGSARTQAQSVKAYAYSIGVDFPARINQVIVSAGVLLQGNPFRINGSRDDKVTLLKRYKDFGSWLSVLVTNDDGHVVNDYSFVLRAGIVAAMIQLWEAVEEGYLFEFWGPVLTGADLSRNSPQLMLRNFLLTARTGMNASLIPRPQAPVSSHEINYKVIRAWNAWANKESLNFIKYSPRYLIPEIINLRNR